MPFCPRRPRTTRPTRLRDPHRPHGAPLALALAFPVAFALALLAPTHGVLATPGQGAIPLQPPAPPTRPPAHWLSAAELAACPGDCPRAVDARGATAYRAGHLPGALNLIPPLAHLRDAAALRRALAAAGLPADRSLVVYGDGEDPLPMARLFHDLERAGVRDVAVLAGGFAAWERKGLPVSRESVVLPAVPADGAAAALPATVSGEWLEQRFGRPDIEILDLRDGTMDENEPFPAAFRSGHVPHALPFDVTDVMPPDGGWPDPDALYTRLAHFGIRAETPVDLDATFVLYGWDDLDPRPALGYLLLRRLGLRVRVMEGGWKRWSLEDRPRVRVASSDELYAWVLEAEPGFADRATETEGGVAGRPQPARLPILDLREERDFELIHVPGSVNLPRYRFDDALEDTVARLWPSFDRRRDPLIVLCYGRHCIRSRHGATVAARLGFAHVIWYRGGIEAWEAAGLPVVRDVPSSNVRP